jgi:hypothetical protein
MNEEEAEDAEAINWNIGIMGLKTLFWGALSSQYSLLPLFPFLILCVLRDLCG